MIYRYIYTSFQRYINGKLPYNDISTYTLPINDISIYTLPIITESSLQRYIDIYTCFHRHFQHMHFIATIYQHGSVNSTIYRHTHFTLTILRQIHRNSNQKAIRDSDNILTIHQNRNSLSPIFTYITVLHKNNDIYTD